MNLYVDSSVLLRVILGERGRLRQWVRMRSAIASELIRVECLRTVDRARIRLGLGDAVVAMHREHLFEAIGAFSIVPLDSTVLDRASAPFPTLIGTLDAIHLASALTAREVVPDLTFATHDEELGLAARSVGFRVLGIGSIGSTQTRPRRADAGRSLVIVNPYGSRVRDPARRAALVKDVAAALERRDGEPLRGSSRRRRRVTRDRPSRPRVAEGVAAVVGIGGDGTLREIAASLAGTGIPLGIVPGGTGNLLAGILGIPPAPARSRRARWSTPSPARSTSARSRSGWPDGPDGGRRTGRRPRPAPRSRSAAAPASMPASWPRPRRTSSDASGGAPISPRRCGSRSTSRPSPTASRSTARRSRPARRSRSSRTWASSCPASSGRACRSSPTTACSTSSSSGRAGPLHGMKGLVDQLFRTHLGGGSGSDSLRVRGRVIDVEAERPEPLQVDGDHVGWGSLAARVLPGRAPRARAGGERSAG